MSWSPYALKSVHDSCFAELQNLVSSGDRGPSMISDLWNILKVSLPFSGLITSDEFF